MTPLIRAVVEFATCTVEFAVIVTVPDNVPAAEKFTAPADDTPAPATDNGSADVTAPISRVAPLETTVRCESPVLPPSAFAWVILTVPVATLVSPV